MRQLCLAAFLCTTAIAQAPDVPPLPKPTGSFAVGRVTVHWTDRSRTEPLSPDRAPRELMVDVWYPSDAASGPTAEYLDRSAFERPATAERLRGYLRGAYEAVKTGRVRTHAIERGPFARSVARAPALVFSHGGGEMRETYTAQLEDLASHGYVVAAITHTYDATLAAFPDGRHVLLAPARWPRPTVSTVEGLPPGEEMNRDRLRWGADDFRFVYSQLNREDETDPARYPFVGRVDLLRVGAFGHSLGGAAAAHACQIDRRFSACLNQDGLSAFAPFYLDDRGWGMDQAFMLIARAPRNEPPTDADLAKMNMTRQQADALVARLKARQLAALQHTGKGSYHIVLDNTKTTHADFGDLPLLQSRDDAEAAARARVLATVRSYTRAFFDQQLKGLPAPLLDRTSTNELVIAVDAYPPPTRER